MNVWLRFVNITFNNCSTKKLHSTDEKKQKHTKQIVCFRNQNLIQVELNCIFFSKAEKEKYFIKSYCKKKIGYLYRKMIVFFQVIVENNSDVCEAGEREPYWCF